MSELLTHDTRPVAKARAIGLKFVFIPDTWLRAPEPDAQQKEIRRLNNELKRLTAASPALSLHTDPSASDNRILVLRRKAFAALNFEEMRELRRIFLEKFSLENVEARLAADRSTIELLLTGQRHKYIPPSEAEIEKYRIETYPKWVDACIRILEAFPAALNSAIPTNSMKIILSNDGTRPAENVRISFTARGPFLVAPPPFRERKPPRLPQLPKAPLPPQGHSEGNRVDLNAILEPSGPTLADELTSLYPTQRRDEEIFYFDPHRPHAPVQSFDMTCKRLPHKLNPEAFEIEVFPQEDKSDLRGAIEVQLSASNIQDVIACTFPVIVTNEFNSSVKEIRDFVHRAKLIGPEYVWRRPPWTPKGGE